MIDLQEYDLKFKSVHIKFYGLCWLASEVVDTKEDDPFGWEQEIEMYNVERASPLLSLTLGTHMCASISSMALFPLTYLPGRRDHPD